MLDVSAEFRRDWRRLWKVAESVAAEIGGDPASVFGFAGLYLEDPYRPGRISDYPNGPLNAIKFAENGGDGEHFCALFEDEEAPEVAPVIFTVPLADEPNQVVGESLPEFLALGCVTGYCLTYLAYDYGRDDMGRPRMLQELQTRRTPDDPERAFLLAALIEEFDLHPWPDVPGRLDELAAQYAGKINWTPWSS